MQKVIVYLGTPTTKDLELYPEDIKVPNGEKVNLFQALKEYSLQLLKETIIYKCAGFNNDEEERRVEEDLEKILHLAEVNIFTIKKHEKDYVNNLFDNLKQDFSPVKALFGKINKPCVIISAGPALDKNIKDLDTDKVIVICVAPVLEKLNKLNINVDFVVSMDTSDSNIKHFKNLTKYPPLVFDCGINPKITKNYKGTKYMSFGNSPVANGLSIDMGKIETGMSVSHYAYNFASKLGCETIILIGQDLALTNGRLHCECVNSSKEKEDIMEVNGYYGNSVKTTSTMNNYIYIFEKMIKEYEAVIKCFNCTEGGAEIKGASNIALSVTMKELKKLDNYNLPYETIVINVDYEEKLLKHFVKEGKYCPSIGKMVSHLAIDVYLDEKMPLKQSRKIIVDAAKYLHNKMVELKGDSYARIFKIK